MLLLLVGSHSLIILLHIGTRHGLERDRNTAVEHEQDTKQDAGGPEVSTGAIRRSR